ncbi:hypothetical protein JTB14_027453 [Gonioctena quinquepunctata]|nr:hypothetical protein JTB14_027453 [Gonioctena quinquepunctata]
MNGNVKKKTRGILNRNHLNRDKDMVDVLHGKAETGEQTPCSNQVCLGSMMTLPFRSAARPDQDILKHAKDFLDQYFTSIRR